MPFEEDEEDLEKSQKYNLKKVSPKASFLDKTPKKPSSEEFHNKTKEINDQLNDFKVQFANLAAKFNKTMEDRELSSNKSILVQEFEKELVAEILELSTKINNDPNEQEGMGSLAMILLLVRNLLIMRDRINQLEYDLANLKKSQPT